MKGAHRLPGMLSRGEGGGRARAHRLGIDPGSGTNALWMKEPQDETRMQDVPPSDCSSHGAQDGVTITRSIPGMIRPTEALPK